MDKLHSILKKHHLRLTRQRDDVFRVLTSHNERLTLQAIVKACPEVDRVSIYRILDTFTRIGVVTVVQTGWKHYYELSEIFTTHHHHVTCISCGKIIPIQNEQIERVVEEIVHDQGLRHTSHSFEIQGICAECQSTAKIADPLTGAPVG